jgi:hypothetical protein
MLWKRSRRVQIEIGEAFALQLSEPRTAILTLPTNQKRFYRNPSTKERGNQ